MTDGLDYTKRPHAGRVYTETNGDGVVVAAPDAAEELTAAASAATLTAENIKGRYGDQSEAAQMFRTSATFANDVVACDTSRGSGDEKPVASGQLVDVILLGQASAYYAEVLRREHNTGGDAEGHQEAVAALVDIYDRLIRPFAIRAIRGQMEQTDHRYAPE